MEELDGTAEAWDESEEEAGEAAEEEEEAEDDWDAEEPTESAVAPRVVPEPEPEPEPLAQETAGRRVKKGKKRFKDLLAEKDEEHTSENLDAFTTTSKAARPKHVAEAERAAKAAEKAERIREAAARAEKARRAAEDEPESWDDQEDVGEEELDSWDAAENDEAASSGTAAPSKPVYDKAQLLSFKDSWKPSQEAEDAAVAKVEAIFGPVRAKPQERPTIEEMDKKTRADDEERGDSAGADQQARGKGGDDKLSWRKKQGPGLAKTDNAWKPGRGRQSEDQKTLKKVNGLLNKLTLEKFEPLLERFLELPIDSPELLRETINLIFDKATSEEKFCPMYANLCEHLTHKFSEEAVETMENFTVTEGAKQQTFRRLLLNQCQEEFEKEKKLEVLSKAEMAQLSEDEREQVLLKERRCKVRSLGNIIFIAELFKEKMLNEVIMHECIVRLLTAPEGSDRPDEESIECLCKLLTTVGAHLDHDKAQGYMKKYFKLISKYADEPDISSRMRFMLQDLIEMRESNWTPRTKVDGPKTIREVHMDAMEEARAHQRGNSSNGQRGAKRMQPHLGPRGERVRPTVTHGDNAASTGAALPARNQDPAIDQIHDGPMAELERYLAGSLSTAVTPAGAEKVQRWIYDNVDAAARQGPEFARAAVRSVLRVASSEVASAGTSAGAHHRLPVHLQQRWRGSFGALCPFLAWCTRSQGRVLQLAALHEAESMCSLSAWTDTRAAFTCMYEHDVAEPQVFLEWHDQAGARKMNGANALSGWIVNLAAALRSNALVGYGGENDCVLAAGGF